MLVKRIDRAFPFTDMRTDLDRIFKAFDSPFHSITECRNGANGWIPSLEVSQTEDHLIVSAELPGVDPDKIDITVEGDVLTIAGSKEEIREEKIENVFHTERSFGEFKRGVTLPFAVEDDGVEATFDHGVLTIRLARQENNRTRRIPVRTLAN